MKDDDKAAICVAIDWRNRWTALARHFCRGRSQKTQERIERRAVLANRKVGRLMTPTGPLERAEWAKDLPAGGV